VATVSDDLIAEARALAKPSLHLISESNGNQPIAFWGGPGIIPPPEGKDWEHRLSVNCDWLAAQDLAQPGWISVYLTYDDCKAELA
jgi:hypothetical protein